MSDNLGNLAVYLYYFGIDQISYIINRNENPEAIIYIPSRWIFGRN